MNFVLNGPITMHTVLSVTRVPSTWRHHSLNYTEFYTSPQLTSRYLYIILFMFSFTVFKISALKMVRGLHCLYFYIINTGIVNCWLIRFSLHYPLLTLKELIKNLVEKSCITDLDCFPFVCISFPFVCI